MRDAAKIQKLVKGGVFGRDDMERALQRRYGDYNIALLIDTCPLAIVATDANDTKVFGFAAFSLTPPSFVANKVASAAASNSGAANAPNAASGDEMTGSGGGGGGADTAASESAPGVAAGAETAAAVAGDKLIAGAWDAWIKTLYDFKDATIHNTAFIAFFFADPDISLPFLDTSINTLYELLPLIKNICYFLPDSLILFPPFSSPRYIPPTPSADASASANAAAGGSGGNGDAQPSRRRFRNMKRGAKYFTEAALLNPNATFSLQVCHRRDVLPTFRVRRARVEDCDDLVPMFRRQNLLKGEHADYYLAGLVESKSEAVRTLVAEADGEVVGFMSINREIDQAMLHDVYHLEMFDYLMKEVKPVPKAKPQQPKASVSSPAAQDTDASNMDAISTNSNPKLSLSQPAPPAEEDDAINPTDMRTPNAFCVNMFCIENQYANHSIEFIRVAFQMFSARDYCLVSLPPNTPEIKLLDRFSKVKTRAGKIAAHNLYITNRFGCGDLVNVRRAVPADVEPLDSLTFGLKNQQEIMSSVRSALTDPQSDYVVYTAESLGQLTCCIVLQQCRSPQAYTDQYEIERFMSPKLTPLVDKPVLLRQMIFNPLFEVQARWVFQEVMRQSQSPCLLFLVDEAAQQDLASQRVALRELVPVKRRRVIEFPDNMRDGVPMPDPLPFNLQLITPSLIFEPRIAINSRIVVLGGSDVSTAFLERLVYTPHLHFTHLTLISKGGPPRMASKCHFVNQRCYTSLELDQLALDYYVDVICESTEELDRESKLIHLDSGRLVPYDYLVMCPGMQYQVSKLDAGLAALSGVYSMVKHEEEAIMAGIDKLKQHDSTMAVVFGRSVQAYATVEMLLKRGVPGSRIAMVDPTLPTKATCFDDPVVEDRVFGHLVQAGVHHYRGYRILKWATQPESNPPTLFGLVLLNREDSTPVRLPIAEMLIYADERSIDKATFKFINDSCLVFDGRLVIDKYFRTQDPFIFGAGSITKYASRYQTKWSHAHYDSKEVGTKLAETLLNIFDPTLMMANLPEDSNDLIEFVQAKKIEAYLPGGHYYLYFNRPHLPGQLASERANKLEYVRIPTAGRDLVIDRLVHGYFSIHLDPQGYIWSVTFIGQEKIPTDNILCLYGLHEKYLNRLVARFDEGVIYDFVKFLSEPWALPLYHDRFPGFAQVSREEAVKDPSSDEMKEIVAHLKHHVDKDEVVPMAQMAEREHQLLYKLFDQSADRRQWDAKVFEFLLDTTVFKSFP
ncbi:hypothetical protein BC831DRAFT_498577 [Entophlyctis helioformis]|nr:hypothetical protein BC831DRAFT_498577 [Entophlyctis helioformis]